LGCAQGRFTETFTPGAEPTSGLVEKTLTCKSGTRSGTFAIMFAYGQRYEFLGAGETPSAWTVTDTTGDFTGLTGQRTLTFSHLGYVDGKEKIAGTIEYTPYQLPPGHRSSCPSCRTASRPESLCGTTGLATSGRGLSVQVVAQDL